MTVYYRYKYGSGCKTYHADKETSRAMFLKEMQESVLNTEGLRITQIRKIKQLTGNNTISIKVV